jgi:glycerate-2-kinase
MKERRLLREMFEAAISAASPDKAVPPNLPEPPLGRTVVVGAGKAAASMARAVEAHWQADKPLSGLVVTRYGHGVGPLKRIEVVEAAHPIPDAAGSRRQGGSSIWSRASAPTIWRSALYRAAARHCFPCRLRGLCSTTSRP